MLTRLLDLIKLGGSLTPASLATQLGTTPSMVEMMLEELTRLGLLKESDFQNNCDQETCGTCYLAKSCKPQNQRVWLTKQKE
jgi:predicted transcriptional regulator